MVNNVLISKERQRNDPTPTKAVQHCAFYHAISKQRWTVSQKRELQFWKQEESLALRKYFAQTYYLPLLKEFSPIVPDDGLVLEIGSGPVCMAQHLGIHKQTYIDPLLDDYRRLFPGIMPEGSIYRTDMAEKAEFSQSRFDVIICLNTLSHVLNPELVLNQVEDSLKTKGVFMVSVDIWPFWLARSHVFLSRFAPSLPRINSLYSYTYNGIFNTLSRHFRVVKAQRIEIHQTWFSLKQEWFFVCEPLAKRP